MKKILFAFIGVITTGLGILGVWLPGLPTTVFILIALWAFSNSSPRLHNWLVTLPILKLAVLEANRFQEEGSVSLWVKYISQISAWLSFAFVVLLLHNVVVSVIVGLVALACSIFMFLVPTSYREPTVLED